MSGDHYHFGDRVEMYGGSGNRGIVKNAAPTVLDPRTRAAIEELTRQLRELKAELPPLSAQTIDESLPVIAPDAAVDTQTRTRALLAVAGVAATAGALGVPIVEAVNTVLQLLSA
ncbi:hypothetical protein [Streptomyces sp. AC558_RSS880]|uniref:hypothetical protein n=1 Tax=Streptomyces sp. AC558_RSS880 TaxID=2823687 RepID=UPI001C23B3F0|nr:hypothetical protein [Streptomyces sp. AC558_RSS880]